MLGHLWSQVYWSTRAQRVLKLRMIVPGLHIAKRVVQLEVHFLDAGGVCDLSRVVLCARLLLQLKFNGHVRLCNPAEFYGFEHVDLLVVQCVYWQA